MAGPPGTLGYALSQRCQAHRGGVRLDRRQPASPKTRFRGTEWVDAAFTLATAAYNVVRLPKLLAGGAP
jgi:hypothetical protein